MPPKSQPCDHRDLLKKYQPRKLAEKFDGLDSNVNRFIARGTATASLSRLLALTGLAGSGKGTTSRILARRHCCENQDLHPFDPCLRCDGCRSLQMGTQSVMFNEFGYVEFDATRMDGDKICAAIEREAMTRAFSSGRRKLFCVDEIQRNRTGVQERLLRLAENIRSRIIICAINPGDLLPALLDRCTHLALKPPSRDQVVAGLTRIAHAESFNLDGEAAGLIARSTANNPRRSVKLLQTAMTIAEDVCIETNIVVAALEMSGEHVDDT